jgi:carbon monoxide dehydrogenase subunit G
MKSNMEIKNCFNVPLEPAETWCVLMDIPRIAPCMPGAELLEQIDDRTYKGKVSVKLGPVALSFVGTARFETIDETKQYARVAAQGIDAKGRGGAAATVHFQLVSVPDGTRVDVTTDMTLTGSVAQYGRATGIIQGVSTQLLNQFAGNLKRSLTSAEPGTAVPVPSGESRTSATAAVQSATPISGLGLFARVIWDAARRFFGRSAAV